MGASDFANLPHIGAAVRRKEDYRFLTGAGQYTDDVVLAAQAHAVFVRSSGGHGQGWAHDWAVCQSLAWASGRWLGDWGGLIRPLAPGRPGGMGDRRSLGIRRFCLSQIENIRVMPSPS